MSTVSTAEAASTTTSVGTSRRTSRLTFGPGDSDAPGVSALRSTEPPKKKPDSARNTSTPPDTRPNHTWKIATSAIATPRSPSKSWRYNASRLTGAGTVATTSGTVGTVGSSGRVRVRVMVARQSTNSPGVLICGDSTVPGGPPAPAD